MPEEIVRREYAKFGPIDLMDTKRLKKFADKFRVDPQVMAIRLGQLSKSSLCAAPTLLAERDALRAMLRKALALAKGQTK